jgi:hypothetical protein
MKIFLGVFNAKVGTENIFKSTIENESLDEIINDNGVRVVNFATSENRIVKSTMFPHRNIHKHTWTRPDGKTHSQIEHILIDRQRQSSVLDVRFEVFTAVTMKNGVFWVVTPCGPCKNRRFGEIWRLLHQGDKNR